LAAALESADSDEARRSFSDRLEHGLKQRLKASPAPISSLVETLVVAKIALVSAHGHFAFYDALKRVFAIVRTTHPGPYGCFSLKRGTS
jgi:hypothetical protein